VKKRDLIVGILIIAVLGVVVYLWRTRRRDLRVPEPTPTPSVQEEIQERFNVVLPEDAQKVQLKDVEGKDATAIATRVFSEGTFILTVLADLPVPNEGEFYQGWITKGQKGDKDYKILTLGRLSVAKGGYIVEFKASQDYSDYERILISKESTADKEIEEIVLEGTF
jgi:hypothetical protein